MVPPGLDEEIASWGRHYQHREACIAAVKRSGDYIAVAQHFARPVTPDPRQPEVSKRAWEKSARQWRMDMKALVADGLAGRDDANTSEIGMRAVGVEAEMHLDHAS